MITEKEREEYRRIAREEVAKWPLLSDEDRHYVARLLRPVPNE